MNLQVKDNLDERAVWTTSRGDNLVYKVVHTYPRVESPGSVWSDDG